MKSSIVSPSLLAPHLPVETAVDLPVPVKDGPQQLLTRAFIRNGELATALGRSSQAPRFDGVALLTRLQRAVEGLQPSPASLVELSEQLAETVMTERGGQAILDEASRQALSVVLEHCNNRLAQLPSNDASHAQWSQVCQALHKVRFHQSISQLTTDSHSRLRVIPDLLALTQLDPHVLSEPSESLTHFMLFASFVRTAKYRGAELLGNLRNQGPEITRLLQGHASTLAGLASVLPALHALEQHCADPSTAGDLRSLQEVTVDLLKQLQSTGITPSQAPGEPVINTAETKTTLKQALLETGKKIVKQFDAYGGLAPMDDKALLRLMRQPAPHLTPAQMHIVLNSHVLHLTPEQLDIVSNTSLPAPTEYDLEAVHFSSFDEKIRLALAAGTLVLNDRQLRDLERLPKADSLESDVVRQLLGKDTALLNDAEQHMLKAVTQSNARGQIDAWQAHNAKLPDILDKSGLPSDVRKELLGINSAMNAELSTLKNGASVLSRFTASPAMLLLLAPLPLAVSLVSGDKSYSSSLVAHFTKNAVFMAGLMMNELTNKRTNKEHMLNRYFVTVLSNAIVAQPTFARNTDLLHKVGFGMGAALTSGAITLGVFNRDSIGQAIKSALGKLSKQESGVASIEEADREVVVAHFDRGEQIADQVRLAVDLFKKDQNITDIMNSSLSFLGGKSAELKALFTKAEAARSGLELEKPKRHANPDFYPKMGLVVLAAGVSAALVGLLDTLVGKADYAADAIWCASEMLKQALDPDADMQKAVQMFKDIVGLNLVMTAFLGVNKGWNFLEKGNAGYAGGAAVLTAANLTLPGMVGNMAGTYAGKGLSYMAEQGRALHKAGKSVLQGSGAAVADAYMHMQSVNRWQPPVTEVEHTPPGAWIE
ncbi:MAG: Effector protein hopW1-1 [Pseudomonas sp.]|nr:MAG: Effector protein hopW1-1 [Pseudomonas sp.]